MGEDGVTYTLGHLLNQSEYLITAITHLLPLEDSAGDFVAFNTVQYVPKGDEPIQLGDIVMINVTTTLPEMYSTLGNVLSRFATQSYDTTQNQTLIRLGNEYHRTAAELQVLSTITEDIPFDKPIASSITVVMDSPELCEICILACGVVVIGGCALVCYLYAPICIYCIELLFYIEELHLGCMAACALLELCP